VRIFRVKGTKVCRSTFAVSSQNIGVTTYTGKLGSLEAWNCRVYVWLSGERNVALTLAVGHVAAA
jgi:hypothetical protein